MNDQPRAYEFTLILDADEITDEMANRLHEAGCSDATPSQSGGEVRLRFSREAKSSFGALWYAHRDVVDAGYRAVGIMIGESRL